MASAWALIVDHEQILLTQRACNTSRPNQWCLPGGGIKSDETAVEACLRETREETGLVIEIQSRLVQIEDAAYFLCHLVSERGALAICHTECQAATWCVPEELLALGRIMDLSRLIPIIRLAGLAPPPTPAGLDVHELN